MSYKLECLEEKFNKLKAFGIRIRFLSATDSIHIIESSGSSFFLLGIFLPALIILIAKLYEDNYVWSYLSIIMLIVSLLSFLGVILSLFLKKVVEFSPVSLGIKRKVFNFTIGYEFSAWDEIKGFSYIKTDLISSGAGLTRSYHLKLIIDTQKGNIQFTFKNIPRKTNLGSDREYMRYLITCLTEYAKGVAGVKKTYSNIMI